MPSFFVKNTGGGSNSYSIPREEVSLKELHELVRVRESLPDDGSWYLRGLRGFSTSCRIISEERPEIEGNVGLVRLEKDATLFITPYMLGGKGGFGTELRLQSKKKGPKQVTNFGACRDLSGRRLRHVNDALLLQKWKEAKESGEKYDPSKETTQSGIENWFLATPSWADVKKKSPGMAFAQGKRKTSLCPNWLEARKDGKRPPSNAPSWWGCPRGRSCKFAHGEGDMERTSLLKYREGKRAEQRQREWNERDAYVASVTESYYKEDDLAAMVSQGLAQASKRRKVEPKASEDEGEGEGAGAGERAAEEATFEGDFPLLCVNGDVDVTGCFSKPAATQIGGNLATEEGESGVMEPSIDRYLCEGVSSFGTVIAPGLALREGSYYYEVRLATAGIMQLGWATSAFLERAKDKGVGDGCGDDAYSWGYCGNRGMLWHADGKKGQTPLGLSSSSSSSSPSSKVWRVGQVLGCNLSLGAVKDDSTLLLVKVSYSLDGAPLTPCPREETVAIPAGGGMFPALSLEAGERVEVNLGTMPFMHCPSGSAPVKDGFCDNNDVETTAPIADPVIAPTTAPASLTFTAIALEEDRFEHRSAAAVQTAYSAEHLKWELQRRGLKAGGTHAERAQRLFLVRGLEDSAIENKLRAKRKG
jgi:hypothetical protein